MKILIGVFLLNGRICIVLVPFVSSPFPFFLIPRFMAPLHAHFHLGSLVCSLPLPFLLVIMFVFICCLFSTLPFPYLIPSLFFAISSSYPLIRSLLSLSASILCTSPCSPLLVPYLPLATLNVALPLVPLIPSPLRRSSLSSGLLSAHPS